MKKTLMAAFAKSKVIVCFNIDSFFPIMMMFTRNKTTKNTCNSAPTTIYCAVGEKSKFKMLNSNNN